ncbi:MAG: ABC transporter substrate-binding protein [Chlorobiaceae bacterium]|nr:ABC transporter substrate-binding protein [Chlorobiaceae bacterium]
MDKAGKTLACCGAPQRQRQGKMNGTVPLLRTGAINLFINLPCPLKQIARRVIGDFVQLYNTSHDIPIYSPMLTDVDASNIDGDLKAALNKDEIPDVLVASGLHTVLSRTFRAKFIDTGIYTGLTGKNALRRMPDSHQKLLRKNNIGILATGFWSMVCDLSISQCVPSPREWRDLVDPLYKGLISVHGHHGMSRITSLLMILKEQLGNGAVGLLAENVSHVWHFDEIVRRIDSSYPGRTPFNLLPNTAIVKMPAHKRMAILEFDDGPIISPILMFCKTSRLEECRPVINFLNSMMMRDLLHQGGLVMADDFGWNEPFSYPSWEYLLNCNYGEVVAELDSEFKKSLRPGVFRC